MDNKNILKRFINFLENNNDGYLKNVKMSSKLKEDLDLDSMDFLDIAYFIEQETDKNLSDDVLETFETVSDVVLFIKMGMRKHVN
ncbi:acyl carrier protein [Apilactobacillus micheneri]|uniref:acyl carrier protein n=1 Tax=Apilactobacillus micheneri TaxID=1899430 RepID=UPI000D522C09|nr:acyl carrier protein [Apilactobacillus micheneri]GAY79778.1 acyl carrier protein [Apilactobacillus micheneri]